MSASGVRKAPRQLALIPRPVSEQEQQARERLKQLRKERSALAASNLPLAEVASTLAVERAGWPEHREVVLRLLVLSLAKSEAHRAHPVARALGLNGDPQVSTLWWGLLEKIQELPAQELWRVGLHLTFCREGFVGPDGALRGWLPEVAQALGVDLAELREELGLAAEPSKGGADAGR